MADILGERDDNVPETPTRVSEPSRKSQLPKRFYKDVVVAEEDGLHVVKLDERPVKTPGKSPLGSTSAEIARTMAAEWRDQIDVIDPLTMPVTRLVNTAIDGVASDLQVVQEDIVRFASSDMLCYRADGPSGLDDLHREHWDPLIDWCHVALGARFSLAQGIVFVEQPAEAMTAFNGHVGQIVDPTALAACHLVTTLTGSAIIAMAVYKGEIDLDEAWKIAHVDEDWNISHWGEDEDAKERRVARFVDMKAACTCIAAITWNCQPRYVELQ
ncbi:MAG: ATPase [Rhizobiaceae bacterium]|nr:ATPase [Rhizobiaceae bacterium]